MSAAVPLGLVTAPALADAAPHSRIEQVWQQDCDHNGPWQWRQDRGHREWRDCDHDHGLRDWRSPHDHDDWRWDRDLGVGPGVPRFGNF
ncbi:hypothetical protein M1M07_31245 [Rhodococcus sp. HM1]|uniref:hypothetical protein n=1 Tax=unclassified Rhodococcus (in: high G+C Gram-positive bacteria) TaxID=192944 RepID=UPI0018CDF046|nr:MULTISPECIES: hypothetical protein [unclassified Rhodococcus (in: high G+C Gram-positive bacteria)]MBH0121953.1 hypothetical protein [Rhodococcus sp. CX]MCK8675567.1 hypothetical protein [Rhodococcus sp. HM1]